MTAVFLAALAWDLVLGEPPNALHPVCWLGYLISLGSRFRPASAAGQLAYGAALTIGLVALAAGVGFAVGLLPAPWRYLAACFLLKSALSLRALVAAGRRVALAMEASDLEAARKAVGMIVSRPVAELDAPLVASAAVQSVSENLCDSFVAPLFYFALLGLPGALAYRAANTLDAMIGYRGHYERVGKVAARLDDLLNWVPARLTAALLLLAGQFTGRPAWRAWWRDRHRTPSPNGGHPMAAAAGIVGRELVKVGYYTLGSGPSADAGTIRLFNRYALGVGLVASALTAWWVR